jgi:hypothetical protein
VCVDTALWPLLGREEAGTADDTGVSVCIDTALWFLDCNELNCALFVTLYVKMTVVVVSREESVLRVAVSVVTKTV